MLLLLKLKLPGGTCADTSSNTRMSHLDSNLLCYDADINEIIVAVVWRNLDKDRDGGALPEWQSGARVGISG
jgi:hypothetical protein